MMRTASSWVVPSDTRNSKSSSLDISDTSAVVESPSLEHAATPKIKNPAATAATVRRIQWFLDM